jgi:hypothetical protein
VFLLVFLMDSTAKDSEFTSDLSTVDETLKKVHTNAKVEAGVIPRYSRSSCE